MKAPLQFAVAALSLLTFISSAHATSSEHCSVAFSASIYTSVSTGTDAATLKVTKVSNGTIFNQLVASGSFSGETAADMAIVLNVDGTGGDFMDVIDKSSHATLFRLMVSGTDSNDEGAVLSGHASGKVAFIENNSFVVNLPDGSTFNATALLRATGDGIELTPIFNLGASFTGGAGLEVIQGSFRKHGKTYTY